MKTKAKQENSFKERVFEVVKKIPKGKTLTYGEVARRAGSPGAARSVGTILKSNQDKNIYCYRVVRSDGKESGYNGLHGKSKKKLLEKERKAVRS